MTRFNVISRWDPVTASIGKLIAPFLSRRFVRYCAVGLSGTVVNLGALALLADVIGWHVNLASALAIEVSILSNFAINERWTFRDKRAQAHPLAPRFVRFHLVSLASALVQWSVFLLTNLVWYAMLAGSDAVGAYMSTATNGGVWAALSHLVQQPPDVGAYKYLSQFIGIGVATGLNFLGNLYWTWGRSEEET